MGNLGNLTGTQFKGFFQREPKIISEELEPIKNNPEKLEQYKKDFEKTNVKGEFDLWILHHNLDSGLFVGRANDSVGSSGIVGLIKQDQIKFEKFYIRNSDINLNRMCFGTIDHGRNFKIIEYLGKIEKPDDKITAGGNYHMQGYNEKMSGNWRMDSI